MEERKQRYARNRIIYSDLGPLQRDYLVTRYFSDNDSGGIRDPNFHSGRAGRNYVAVIDECDSELIDGAGKSLFLSHNISDFKRLEHLHLVIQSELYRVVERESMDGQGGGDPGDPNRNNPNSLPSGPSGIVGGQQQTPQLSPSLRASLTDEVYDTVSEEIRRKDIKIPPTIVDYVDRHLRKWVENAFVARFDMQENNQYIVPGETSFVEEMDEEMDEELKEKQRAKKKLKEISDGDNGDPHADLDDRLKSREGKILIMNKETGVEQESCKWSEGFHQFIELRHMSQRSQITTKAVFSSNMFFVNGYSKVLGLTGTLGGSQESAMMRAVYGVDRYLLLIVIIRCRLTLNLLLSSDDEGGVSSGLVLGLALGLGFVIVAEERRCRIR